MPYTCEYCNATFTRKNTLQSHKKTTFYCLQLQGKNDVIENIRTEHVCPICNNDFSSKSNLRCHIKKFHSDSDISKNDTHKSEQNISLSKTSDIDNNGADNIPFVITDVTPDWINKTLKDVLTKI